jgi:D-alanyl-lipoteichoic acid acyltransferase DltB (MBOAT superfamily)
MLLTTPEYFCFLVLLFLLFWALFRWQPAALALVLAANLFFYWRWGWIYLLLIPLAATADFLIARAIGKTKAPLPRRLLVVLSVGLNLALIVTSKVPPGSMGILLPLSLSFYAFQALTYTIDVYRRDAKPTESYARYLASVTFFPTTLAGPITQVPKLISQWEKLKVLSSEDGSRALFLIGLGIAKKFLIADYLAQNLIGRVFDTPSLYSGGEVLLAVYAYAFQLYYDFSGYTDIALGSALLLGLKLPANFNRPYEALNLAEFWRRWHISLSNWLRDYLYFSLPGLRSPNKAWTYLNLTVTMVLGGLWHGFTMNFLIWGFLHGAGLAVNRWWQVRRGERKPSEAWAARFVRGFVTFHFVLLAWIFFRADSLTQAQEVLTQIASLTFGFGNVSAGFVIVLGLGVVLHYLPRGWYARSVELFQRAPAPVQAVAMAAVVLSVQYVGATGSAPFVYQKF